MTMFVSKVWGVDDPCGPMVFSTPGWRDHAVSLLKLGDRVALVGTFGHETPEADRNRVLGLMEPSTVHVSTSDFPLPTQDHRAFKPDGTFRWPFALLNRHAWLCEPGLFLAKVAPRSGNPFGSVAASGIVALQPEEETRILAHPFREVALIPSRQGDRKLYGDDAARRRGAPVPTEGVRRSIMQVRDAPAFVYWFTLTAGERIVGHKIGWSFDWKQRLRQFNSVALHALDGLRYHAYRFQLLDTARLAFRIEQRLLQAFDARRHPANREILTGVNQAVLQEAWDRETIRAIVGKDVGCGRA